jgi:hypothetical protein
MTGSEGTLKKKFTAGEYIVLLGREENSRYQEIYTVEEVTPTHIMISLSNGYIIPLEKKTDMLGFETVIIKESVRDNETSSIKGVSIKGLPFAKKAERMKLDLVA